MYVKGVGRPGSWSARQTGCMGADGPSDLTGPHAVRMSDAADRLDELSETAALMGDDDGAVRLRERALAIRMAVMRSLDDGGA